MIHTPTYTVAGISPQRIFSIALDPWFRSLGCAICGPRGVQWRFISDSFRKRGRKLIQFRKKAIGRT